jgi:hypothetical protein
MVHHILDGTVEPVEPDDTDEFHVLVWREDDPEPDLFDGYQLTDTDGDTWKLGPHGWSLRLDTPGYQGVPTTWQSVRRHAPLTGPRPDNGEAR